MTALAVLLKVNRIGNWDSDVKNGSPRYWHSLCREILRLNFQKDLT